MNIQVLLFFESCHKYGENQLGQLVTAEARRSGDELAYIASTSKCKLFCVFMKLLMTALAPAVPLTRTRRTPRQWIAPGDSDPLASMP